MSRTVVSSKNANSHFFGVEVAKPQKYEWEYGKNHLQVIAYTTVASESRNEASNLRFHIFECSPNMRDRWRP